jgi:hypothetical protein
MERDWRYTLLQAWFVRLGTRSLNEPVFEGREEGQKVEAHARIPARLLSLPAIWRQRLAHSYGSKGMMGATLETLPAKLDDDPR